MGAADEDEFREIPEFEVLTGSSIRAQSAVGQVSFGEPGLMKSVDVFFDNATCISGDPISKRFALAVNSGLICAKMASTMASTMAAVSIDPNGPVSFFKRKLARHKSGLFVTIWSQ